MAQNLNEKVKEYGRGHRRSRRWSRALAGLACVLVFCVTYMLILPAITLDRETVCGQEEHTHSAETCYAQELICTDESPEHIHTEGCYASTLICDLTEHTHTQECYAQETEVVSAALEEDAADEGSEEAQTEPVQEEKTEASDVDTAEEADISLAAITGESTVAAGSSITLSCDSRNCWYGSWSSSNTGVATVSGSGSSATVTGISAGTATITHSHSSGWGTSSTTYTVTVTSAQAQQYTAAIYYLQSPTGDPLSNDTGYWAPDADSSTLLAKIEVQEGASYWDNNKNIIVDPEKYVVSWPDGSTETTWTVTRGDAATGSYFTSILNSIWNNYAASIRQELGITDLSQSDVTSITLSVAKISRDNSTKANQFYHIDCRIGVKSSKVYTAKFWVKEPGSNTYNTQAAAKNYKITDSVENAEGRSYYTYNYKVGDTRTVNGVTYVLTGWYTENESGQARSDTKASFDYMPSDSELGDGIVNFYAEWVPAANNLTIVKYEKGNEDTLLSGAVFTLTNSSNTYNFEATGATGETTLTGIEWGTYTLHESTAPANYQSIGDITVTVGDTVSIRDPNNTGAQMKDGKLWIPNEKATVDITVAKVNGTGQPLTGAEFDLYYTDTDGMKYYYSTEGWTADSSKKTLICPIGDGAAAAVSGLTIGRTYSLVETKAPAGYNLLTGEITITPTSASSLTLGGTGATAEGLTVTVTNQTGERLPNTGGTGTGMYTMGGLLLLAFAAAGVLMYRSKKNKIH